MFIFSYCDSSYQLSVNSSPNNLFIKQSQSEPTELIIESKAT